MIYQIYAESKGYYYIHYFKNFLDLNPVSLKISKWDFDEWRIGKIQKPSANIKQLQEKKSVLTVSVNTDEKEIMNQILNMMQDKDYILEKDVIENIKGYSKAKARRTIKKEYVLSSFKLKRIRANKKVKQKYGIAGKGYPFIILCKEN